MSIIIQHQHSKESDRDEPLTRANGQEILEGLQAPAFHNSSRNAVSGKANFAFSTNEWSRQGEESGGH